MKIGGWRHRTPHLSVLPAFEASPRANWSPSVCFRAAPRPVVTQRTESPISTEVLNAALSSWPHAATEVSHRPSVSIIPRRKQWESNPRNLAVQTASNGCPRPCRATSAVVFVKILERDTGLEPVSFAWQTKAQPLYQSLIVAQSERRDSNPQLLTWQESTLPLSYIRTEHLFCLFYVCFATIGRAS